MAPKLAINLAAVAHLQHQDAQGSVLDVGDDSPVPNAVLPKGSKLGTFEGFPDATRVVELGDTSMQESEDTPRCLRVDLA